MQAKLPWIKDMQLQHVLSTAHTKHTLYGTSTLLSPDEAVPWPVTSSGGGGNGAGGGMPGLASSGQCSQFCMCKGFSVVLKGWRSKWRVAMNGVFWQCLGHTGWHLRYPIWALEGGLIGHCNLGGLWLGVAGFLGLPNCITME